MAFVNPDDPLHAVDGLSELRIGRYIIRLRLGLANCDSQTRDAIEAAFEEVSSLYRACAEAYHQNPATATLMHTFTRAISAAAQYHRP